MVSAGEGYCGAFSSAFLRHLRQSTPTTTCADLLRRIAQDIKGQHPICEGDRKDLPLFNGTARRPGMKLLALTNEGQHGYRINMGAACGIVLGSRFSVRELGPNDGVYKCVGVFEARTVHINFSILQPLDIDSSFDVSSDSHATILCWGPSSYLPDVCLDGIPHQWLEASHNHHPRYRVIASRSKSTLLIRSAGDKKITFEPGSPVANYTIDQLRPPVDFTPQTLRTTLNYMSDFRFHLLRENPAVLSTLKDKVGLRMYKLEARTPINPDLFSDRCATVEPGVVYGFTIFNSSDLDLFAYLFFFDPTEYSIQVSLLPSVIRCYLHTTGLVLSPC